MRIMKLVELILLGALVGVVLFAVGRANAEDSKPVITIDFESNPCADQCLEPIEIEPLTEGQAHGE